MDHEQPIPWSHYIHLNRFIPSQQGDLVKINLVALAVMSEPYKERIGGYWSYPYEVYTPAVEGFTYTVYGFYKM